MTIRAPSLRLAAALAVLALSACVDSAPAESPPSPAVLGKRIQRLGEPQNGFPSWGERLVLALTNRARADPDAEIQAVCPTTCSGNYSVGLPLIYDYNLNRAARFHATTLRKAGAGLQHESICVLKSTFAQDYPDVCDGSPSCACVGGTYQCHCSKTDPTTPYCTCGGGMCGTASARTSAFGSGYSGENAAAGNTDPIKSFEQWVKSTGHRNNMLNTQHRKLGVGSYAGGGSCWNAYWVQDFSRLAVASYPVIPGGAHHPQSGSSSTQFSFWANHFESNGQAPQLATVNVEGTCYAMARERGQNGNATYHVKMALGGSGCLRYYFYFRDSAGQVATFPSTGSFVVGVDSTSCGDYDASARPSPGQGCGGCSTAADCDDSNPCTTDTCEGAVGDKRCKNTPTAGCCTSNAQCDDGKPCTTDTCQNNACVNAPKAGCCESAAQCNDNNVCTTDTCTGNVCQNAPVAGCCTSAAQCDDSDSCTSDVCAANACQNTPIQGCCKSASDCDDGSSCTTDSCVAGSCTFTPVPGCCQKDADCADTSACTDERCETSSGTCIIDRRPGCCDSAADCDDSDPCTSDSCAANACQHAPVPNCTQVQPDSGSGGSDGGVVGPRSDGAGPGGSDDGGGAWRDGGSNANNAAGGDLVGGCNVSAAPDGPWLILLLLLLLRRRRRN